MQAQSRPMLLWSSSTCPIFHHLAFNSVYRSLSNLHPSTICFWSFYFFFVCQTWRIASLPFDATSSHAFACYCVEQQKTIFITNYSLFLKRCVIELPCMLDMYGFSFLFFFLSVLEDVLFLSDDSSMAFILHLWPPHFFGTATKKWQDFPPPEIYTSAFQLRWGAPPPAVIRLQWMRSAFLMEADRRGSWCGGGQSLPLEV